MTDRKTAIHEAAHTTMAWVLGHAVNWTSIIPDPDKHIAGETSWVGVLPEDGLTRVIEGLMVILAGGAATSGSVAGFDWTTRGCIDDLQRAESLIRCVTGDVHEQLLMMQWLQRRAINIVLTPEFRALREVVSRALYENEKLSGKTIRQLLERQERLLAIEVRRARD